MKKERREFLKKSLKTAAATAVVTAAVLHAKESGGSGVVSGKAKKNEVLYFKSKAWQQYYDIAY